MPIKIKTKSITKMLKARQLIDDLMTLCQHAETDIGFNGGGSYCKGDFDNSHDPVDAKKAQRAIEYIYKHIKTLHTK